MSASVVGGMGGRDGWVIGGFSHRGLGVARRVQN